MVSVTLPRSITAIGFEAFNNCPKLKSITVARDSYA